MNSSLNGLIDQAETLAKAGTWNEHCLEINSLIIQHAPENLGSLMRLVTYYASQENFSQVQEFSERILAIDPESRFARRRLKAIQSQQTQHVYQGKAVTHPPIATATKKR